MVRIARPDCCPLDFALCLSPSMCPSSITTRLRSCGSRFTITKRSSVTSSPMPARKVTRSLTARTGKAPSFQSSTDSKPNVFESRAEERTTGHPSWSRAVKTICSPNAGTQATVASNAAAATSHLKSNRSPTDYHCLNSLLSEPASSAMTLTSTNVSDHHRTSFSGHGAED